MGMKRLCRPAAGCWPVQPAMVGSTSPGITDEGIDTACHGVRIALQTWWSGPATECVLGHQAGSIRGL